MIQPSDQNDKNYIKIFKFYVKKKTIFIIGILIVVCLLYSAYSSNKKEKEYQARYAEAQRRLSQGNTVVEDEEVLSYSERLQKALREQYGEPPEGFEWGYNGELIALSSEDLTYEDVCYTYIRALSILDFATAQRVASKSNIIDTYNEYYSEITQGITDYYSSFLRKQFKTALETIEINGIEDTAIFADGSAVVTVSINSLDLTDKDFWQDDKQELFEMMRFYDETETDSIKKEQYIYDYIYNAYLEGKVGKKTTIVDFVVGKSNASGWLISDDAELEATLTYEKGVDVANYIFQLYDDWYRDTVLEEQTSMLNNDNKISNSDGSNSISISGSEVVEETDDQIDVVGTRPSPTSTPTPSPMPEQEGVSPTSEPSNPSAVTGDIDNQTDMEKAEQSKQEQANREQTNKITISN